MQQPSSPRQTLNGEKLRESESTLWIATWNVKNLFASGKLDSAIVEMEKMKLNIPGISDVQWPRSGKRNARNDLMEMMNETTVIVSCRQGGKQNGIGFYINFRTSPNT